MTGKRAEISGCSLINSIRYLNPLGKVIQVSENTKRGKRRSLDINYFPLFLLFLENIRE